MGFPSVCCKYVLLPLVNKDAALANGRAEQTQVGKQGERMQNQSYAIQLQEKDVRTLPVPQSHGDTQMNRNGLI